MNVGQLVHFAEFNELIPTFQSTAPGGGIVVQQYLRSGRVISVDDETVCVFPLQKTVGSGPVAFIPRCEVFDGPDGAIAFVREWARKNPGRWVS